MKNRFTILLAFLAVFTLSAPVFAAPPEEDAVAAGDSDNDTETGETGVAAKPDVGDGAPDEEADTDDAAATGSTGGLEPADEIESDEEALIAAKDLYSALQQKHWALALGLGLSLLVFALRRAKLLDKVPNKALPWVTAGLGILSYVVAALMSEGASIPDALLGGASAGVTAVGLWEMVLKHFLGGKKEE